MVLLIPPLASLTAWAASTDVVLVWVKPNEWPRSAEMERPADVSGNAHSGSVPR
jgi:hypothetical protein